MYIYIYTLHIYTYIYTLHIHYVYTIYTLYILYIYTTYTYIVYIYVYMYIVDGNLKMELNSPRFPGPGTLGQQEWFRKAKVKGTTESWPILGF